MQSIGPSVGPIPVAPSSPSVLPHAGGIAPTDPKGASFKDLLLGSIGQVNAMQQDADRLVESLVTGGNVNPAEVLTAVQKADLTFRLMIQVRNKVLQAFEEVRNIRI